jgi:hypothetical protein
MIRADLHIHSCLSPCAELGITPARIARSARKSGLNAIAVCDHNAVDNIPALIICANREGLGMICGIEITTREEVHILGLFPSYEAIRPVAELVEMSLPRCETPEMCREQVIVDHDDFILGFHEQNLAAATDMPLESVVQLIHENEGIAVAAHVDREAFGLIGQLGYFPDGLELDALEISPRGFLEHNDRMEQDICLPVICNSDSHSLEQLGSGATDYFTGKAEFYGLLDALQRGKCRPAVGEI